MSLIKMMLVMVSVAAISKTFGLLRFLLRLSFLAKWRLLPHLLTLWVCKLLMLICILTKNVVTSCSVTMMLFLRLEVKRLTALTAALCLSCGLMSGHLAMSLLDLTKRRYASLLCGVERVERAADGWTVVDDEGACWQAHAVVLAVPAPRLPPMIEQVAPRTAAAARRIQVASSALVVLALPGGTPLPAQSGVLVASGERLHAKAMTLTSRQWGARGNVELV